MQVVNPVGWKKPKGYANAVMANGDRTLFVAGMIGWDQSGIFRTDDLVAQTEQALRNIVTLLRSAGASPKDIVRMTWYLTDKRAYLEAAPQIGRLFREIIGHYDIAMTAVQVVALIEDQAKVEIEVTAVITSNERSLHG